MSASRWGEEGQLHCVGFVGVHCVPLTHWGTLLHVCVAVLHWQRVPLLSSAQQPLLHLSFWPASLQQWLVAQSLLVVQAQPGPAPDPAAVARGGTMLVIRGPATAAAAPAKATLRAASRRV
jgi:hypothetical protein